MNRFLLVFFTAVIVNADPALIDDFEDISSWKPARGNKTEITRASDAFSGKSSLRLSGPDIVQRSMPKVDNKTRAARDNYAGISFAVKGDGSANWSCVTIGAYLWRYVYFFPLNNKEWRVHRVSWNDFVPMSGRHLPPINTPSSLTPAGIDYIWFGDKIKRTWENAPISKYNYQIDQLKFIKDVPEKALAQKPSSFPNFLEKLKSKKDVNIYCVGDSLTAGVGVRKKEDRYPDQLQRKLRKLYKRDNIYVKNRGVGGATGQHLLAWVNKDFAGPPPDLAIVVFGGNDRSYTCSSPEQIEKVLDEYIQRITEATNGKTAILIITPTIGRDSRATMWDCYPPVFHQVAKKWGLPILDMWAVCKKIGNEKWKNYLTDSVHMNCQGYDLFSNQICDFIDEETKK